MLTLYLIGYYRLMFYIKIPLEFVISVIVQATEINSENK